MKFEWDLVKLSWNVSVGVFLVNGGVLIKVFGGERVGWYLLDR